MSKGLSCRPKAPIRKAHPLWPARGRLRLHRQNRPDRRNGGGSYPSTGRSAMERSPEDVVAPQAPALEDEGKLRRAEANGTTRLEHFFSSTAGTWDEKRKECYTQDEKLSNDEGKNFRHGCTSIKMTRIHFFFMKRVNDSHSHMRHVSHVWIRRVNN